MQRTMGNSGAVVSAMGYGAMSFSDFYGPVSDKQIHDIMDAIFDLGITHIDTANVYGKGRSETAIGDYFQKHPGTRDQIFLATKGSINVDGDPSRRFVNDRKTLERDLDASLKRLKLDYVDLYYIHRREQDVPLEELAETLGDFIKSGKVKSVGMSEVAPDTIRRVHEITPLTAVQSEYSLQTRMPELGVSQTCKDLGITLVAFSPVGRGLLTDTPPARSKVEKFPFLESNPRFIEPNLSRNIQASEAFRNLAAEMEISAAGLAIAWCLAQGEHVLPIPGTRHVEHLKQVFEGSQRQLTADECTAVNNVLPMGWISGDRYNARQWEGPENYS